MTTTYVRRNVAADYLQQRCGMYTAGTLAKLACVGGGPRFLHIGRTPLYTKGDLDEWLESRMSKQRASTCDQG